MKKLLFLFCISHISWNIPAQSISCDSFCVTGIEMDSSGSNLNITIFLGGDSLLFINYPYVSAVTDDDGDTLATGNMNFFGQFGSTSQVYGAATILDSVPDNFTAIVYFKYNTSYCALPYPCPAAACSFTPTVNGDLMLCPNEQGMLTTQAYDSYQWYKREYGGIAQPISGATAQTLAIDQFNDAGYYFSVEATDSGCAERSAEVLVDGYVFLLPTVETTGDFTTGINGETIICEGDTAYFTLLPPYDTLITWYENGSPLAVVTGNVLEVTASGNYTVEGAPSICPSFLQPLGVTLVVQMVNCTTGVAAVIADAIGCYWNSEESILNINNVSADVHVVKAMVYSLDGKLLLQESVAPESSSAQIKFNAIAAGTYICTVNFDNDNLTITRKLVITK